MKWWGLWKNKRLFFHLKHRKTLDSSGRGYSQKYYNGLHNLSFSHHGYSCKMFTSGLSINTRLLNWPGLALWGREVLQKGMGVECGFWG